MRKLLSLILVLAAALTLTVGAAAQNSLVHWYWATDYNYALRGQAANTYTFPPSLCRASGPAGPFFVFGTNVPIYLEDAVAASSEAIATVTPINTSAQCGVTISPGNAHYSFTIKSGTAGLQEALNNAQGSATYPAVIYIDQNWYNQAAAVGTPATILGAVTGTTSKNIVDITTSPWTMYKWVTSAYVRQNPGLTLVNTWTAANAFATITNSGSTTQGDSSTIVLKSGNAAQWIKGQASELITLSTSGATTDSTANLLPANALIEGVACRVTTTITTATAWSVGDASTAARFTASDATMTANETQASTGTAWTTGIASASTGIKQTAAAKLRITTTGTPGAGAIRCTVFYSQFVAPTS